MKYPNFLEVNDSKKVCCVETNILNTLVMKDIIEAISIFVTFILWILSIVISTGNSKN